MASLEEADIKERGETSDVEETVEAFPKGEDWLIQNYLGRVSRIYYLRTIWYLNQAKWQNMRRGILDEKDDPWLRSANVHLPVCDQFVRSMKTSYMEVLGVEPPVIVDPIDPSVPLEVARKLENFLSDTYVNRIHYRRPMDMVVDGMLERGECFLKIGYEKIYDYKDEVIDLDKFSPMDEAMLLHDQSGSIEEKLAIQYRMDLENEDDKAELEKAAKQMRSGKRRIVFKKKVVIKDSPAWLPVSGENLLRMPDAPADINQHRFFIHKFYQSRGEIRKKVASGYYDPVALEQIRNAGNRQIYRGSNEVQLELARKQQEGIVIQQFAPGTNLIGPEIGDDVEIETYEINTWYSPDPGRIPERRVVFTLFPVYHMGHFVRSVYLNRPRFMWKEFNYDNPAGSTYGARGIPQLIEYIQLEMNINHNTKIDMLQFMTGMTGTYDPDLMIEQNDGTMRLTPGHLFPAKRGAVEMFQPPISPIPFEREEQSLLGYAETLLGPLQSALSKSGKMGTARTATEIGAVEGVAGRLATYDVERFQESMTDVHLMTIWEIIENMPDNVDFKYKSPDGSIRFDRLHKSEIEGIEFELRPHGNISNANKALESQKWTGRIQMFAQLTQMGVSVDWRELALRWLITDGERNPERLLPPMQQLPPQQQMAMQQQMGGPPNAQPPAQQPTFSPQQAQGRAGAGRLAIPTPPGIAVSQ